MDGHIVDKNCVLFLLQGYLRSKEFIVTEWPMTHTVPDFWSLVYDHDCNSIVVLCDHPPSSVSIILLS